MTKEIRDSFIMYRSFIEMGKEMDDKNRLAFYDAIFDLALDGKETKLSGMAKMAFIGAKPNIIANNKKYENGKKGAKYGIKGGRPKTPKEPLENPNGVLKNNPTKTPNDNYNENKNENYNVKSEIIIPNFIDQILFDEFLQQRKKDKNPIEGMALKLTLEDLEKWENKKTGSANLAIKNAIKGGWKSLIEPKVEQTTKTTEVQSWKYL